jgi:hypothetical protein
MDEYLRHGIAPGGERKGGANAGFRKFRVVFQNFLNGYPF